MAEDSPLMPADFYDLLDVGPEASPEAIRRAYREKAREYHPDVNPDARSSDQFKAIRTAYEVLSDAGKRKDYDRMGHREYVDSRLDGLPGAKSAGSSSHSGGRQSSRSGSQRTKRRARQSGTTAQSSTTASRSGGRTRSSAQGPGTSSRDRSTWGERTISEPGARARAMRAGNHIGAGPVLMLAAIGYLAGLAMLLAPNANVLEAVANPLLAGDIDALLAILQTPGFADPLSFVGPVMDSSSLALLFPVGIVVFPLVLFVHAIRTSRAAWWVPAGFALGPLVGLGLVANPLIVTVAVDLAVYVLLPALAMVGTVVALLRS